jgi:DNA-binding NtrC family response regulator
MEANVPRVLVVDDEMTIGKSCEKVLVRGGFAVRTALSGKQALALLEQEPFDLVFTDLKMVEMGGMELLDALRTRHPDIVAVVITGYATIASVVETMKVGAFDYLPKPFTAEELLAVADKAWERRRRILDQRALAEGTPAVEFQGLVGRSHRMQEVYRMIRQVAPTPSTVLIVGESGTGKELVARAVHALSPRREKPFFAVDCGTLSAELLQSDLFGHVKGAFTGAVAHKRGIMEAADRGTVFLDEICNVDLEVQGKLLRFIQEREFLPLGDTQVRKVDTRLVFATNRDLAKMVGEGTFREDLYYRLHVFPILLPPLRERREDIPLLAYHFIRKLAGRAGRPVPTLSEATLLTLENYDWPGNVRQLEHVLEGALITLDGGVLEPRHLPTTVYTQGQPGAFVVPRTNEEFLEMKRKQREQVVDDLERIFVHEALERNGWNVSHAARDVGMQRQNFQALMRKHGLKGHRPE